MVEGLQPREPRDYRYRRLPDARELERNAMYLVIRPSNAPLRLALRHTTPRINMPLVCLLISHHVFYILPRNRC